jgi:hypothetical protein
LDWVEKGSFVPKIGPLFSPPNIAPSPPPTQPFVSFVVETDNIHTGYDTGVVG